MLFSLRKNRLTSLLKEVRVFKVIQETDIWKVRVIRLAATVGNVLVQPAHHETHILAFVAHVSRLSATRPYRLRAVVANASALYRGQNPQNREKRVSGSKNSHFPRPQKRAIWVEKSPFSLWSPVEKWGFFDSNRPFLGSWEMGVFWPRNPLFPILGILTPVQGRRVRKAVDHKEQLPSESSGNWIPSYSKLLPF